MPKDEDYKQIFERFIKDRVKTFTRIEKAFYGSIVFTAIVLAVSIIYMQTQLLQIENEMTGIKTQMDTKQLEYDEAKQAVNELTRYSRLMEIAEEAGLTFTKENTGVPEE